jgi:hypothetical protein
MKKLLIIIAFAVSVSVAASFGTAQIELIGRPNYDQRRDQQWMHAQQRQREEQQRDQWQRARWQQEQRRRHDRNQAPQEYYFWLQLHLGDYDNRG